MTKKTSITSILKLNKIALFLHLAQGIAMITLVSALGTSKSYDITLNYLTFNEQQQALVPAQATIASINFAWLVASFLFMSALAHAIIVTVYKKKYVSDLEKGINKARWIEYSISASTMMVAIALLSGMNDLASLIMLFGLVAIMNLMGLVMEVVNSGKKEVSWLSYIIGCIAGIIPWVAFGLYVWAANSYSLYGVPGFVYGIYASIFIFFNCFAINMYLQYKKVGKWKDYLYGEKVYIWLSLIAKSALAWQVFGGVFQP
jgi:hypothetical protein